MSSSRSVFLSGTIFGVVLGAVLGHLTIWRFVDSKPSNKSQPYPVVEVAPNGMSYDLGQKSSELPYYPEGSLEPVHDYPEPERHDFDEVKSPLANAIALETVEDEAVRVSDELTVDEIESLANEPKPLDFAGAAPIGILQDIKEIDPRVKAARDKEIRAAIDRELADTPQAQRDIWFESLKDMHIGDATGVIRMWKAIGGPIPGFGEDSLILSPSTLEPKLPTPVFAAPDGNDLTTLVLQKAISIHRRNVLMATAPGYLRIVPRLTEEIIDGVPTITGLVEEFDFTAGPSEQTGNPLDLKIEGGGMFLVADAEGQQYLTRRGRFSLNANRQLCLVDPDAEYILQPPVVIPEPVNKIKITQYGFVEFLNVNGKIVEINENKQVRLALITNPDKLTYVKNGLLKLGDGETQPVLVTASMGCGRIGQGALELSNVNTDHEHRQIEQLREFLSLSRTR